MAQNPIKLLEEAANISGLISEIYGDLAKPGVRQVGKAVEAILGLGNTLLWPLMLINEKARCTLQSNLEKYRKKLESVPEDTIIPVVPELGVPIAEKLAYVSDEELSTLFVNLLATASCKDTVNLAHPSFVNVISNLAPTEARLLVRLAEKPFWTYKHGMAWDKANSTRTNIFYVPSGLDDHVNGVHLFGDIQVALSVLSGLGLVETSFGRAFDEPEDPYSLIRGEDKQTYDKGEFKQTEFISQVRITSYCVMFLKACGSIKK